MDRKVYLQLETLAEARAKWMNAVANLGFSLQEEKIPLAESLDRVISRPVQAQLSSPAFHGAAMDGIAVNAETTWQASESRPLTLELGKDAFWINTGQPLPADTNAIIMVENVQQNNEQTVTIEQAVFPWQHVRKTGEDMVATEIILGPGVKVGPYELGAMAGAGVSEIYVFKKPKVAIIPSGSEIIPFAQLKTEDAVAGRKLPEFNSLIFSALVKQNGGDGLVLPIVPDEPEKILESVNMAATMADLVILNAGSSAGSHDFSSQVITEAGELLTHGIAMMPGKPAVLGIITGQDKKTPIIGAPGYPVSATLILEEFMLPLLAMWLNQAPAEQSTIQVIPINPLPSKPGMEERIRVKLGKVGDKYFAAPLPRGAGTVSSLSRADAIIAIPANSEGINANEEITAKLLRPKNHIDGALLAIGSHDNTLDLLDSMLRNAFPQFRLNSAHVGSLGGLKAIKNGSAHLAGSHLLDPETGIYNQQAIAANLKGKPAVLIRLLDREQGLIVKPGNPANIRDISDLSRSDVTFVNRQKGSGTRVLLDYELQKAGISPQQINGYNNEEYTHMNVAVAVSSDRATTGLGVAAAAKALGLEFIPMGVEQYDLVIPREYMMDPRIEALLTIIRSEKFKQTVNELGGYGTDRTGEVIWEYDGN